MHGAIYQGISQMKLKLFIAIACIFLFTGTGQGSIFPGKETNGNRQTVLQVLPFTHDQSPSAELVSDQAAFILRRLLRAGRFVLPDFSELKLKGIPLVWNSQEQIDGFCAAEAIDWLVVGHIEKISIDTDAECKGSRFLGISGIPIKAVISVYLYDCHRKQEIWKDRHTAKTHIPRMRVFGLYRKPFPKTVKTADAFLHDTMLVFSEQIISTIRSFSLEKGN